MSTLVFCPSCLDLDYARLRDPSKYINGPGPDPAREQEVVEPVSHLIQTPHLGRVPPQPIYPFASWNHSYSGHRTSLGDIEQASATGCKPCRVLSEAIRHHVPEHSLGDGVTILASDDRRTPLVLLVQPDYRLNSLEHGRSIVEVEIFSLPDSPSPWSTILAGRDLPLNTSSPKSLALAKSWIHECVSSHGDCSFSKATLPTRVIDIGLEGNINPKLAVTNGEYADYAALSYCC